MRRATIAIALLAGCIDYAVEPGQDFVDAPVDCALEPVLAAMRAVDPECEPARIEPVADPWRFEVEWRWEGLAADPEVAGSMVAPLVGQLTDDDGDGDVDRHDDPDVVILAHGGWDLSDGTLVVLDGATGREHWHLGGFDPIYGMALGDLDTDGFPDLVAYDRWDHVLAVRGLDGEVLWRSEVEPAFDPASSYPQMGLGDVDADGIPEVIARELVLDGVTGELLQVLSVNSSNFVPTVADIDLDGVQEAIVGSRVQDPSTTNQEWVGRLEAIRYTWVALLNADGDPEAEVVLNDKGQVAVHEHDGTLIHAYDVGESITRSAPPCAGDLDGDGGPEVVIPLSTHTDGLLRAIDPDGTLLWEREVMDWSGAASCSVFDLDADGRAEVLYADQTNFHVLDGRTGEARITWEAHASQTIIEYPVVSDVDRDGAAEILVVHSDWDADDPGLSGLTVLGHAGDGWAPAGAVWNTHDFSGANADEDGQLPSHPYRAWQLHNVYRGRPVLVDPGVDLEIELLEACVESCADPTSLVQLSLQVANVGGSPSLPHLEVSVYRDDGGDLTLLEQIPLVEPVRPGTALPGTLLELTLDGVGTDGLVIRVDDHGGGNASQPECDESDNSIRWAPECP